MHEIRWDDVKDWFNPHENGSLPDVLVRDATMATWDALLVLIRSQGWRYEYDFREHAPR